MREEWSNLASVQRQILETLESAPGYTLSNSELRRQTRLSETQFNKARQILIDRGLVTRRKGRGWPLVLVEDAEVDPDFDDLETRERALYPGLVAAADRWERFAHYTSCRTFDVSSLGRRKTGGPWSRTDLLSVGINDFTDLRFVPHFALSVHAIEVKTWDHISVEAVFEVLSHRDDVTHNWVFTEVPSNCPLEGRLKRVKEQAARYGVGLVTFTSQHNTTTWQTEVEAERRSPKMFDLSQYLETRTTPAVHTYLTEVLARWQSTGVGDSSDPDVEALPTSHEVSVI